MLSRLKLISHVFGSLLSCPWKRDELDCQYTSLSLVLVFFTDGKGHFYHWFTRICGFSVWPLPEVKNWFRKQTWNEKRHFSILFFLKSFGQYLKKSKSRFSIVFSKSDSAWVLFLVKKNSEKAKHPRICFSFGGNMPEAQFWQVPFKAF